MLHQFLGQHHTIGGNVGRIPGDDVEMAGVDTGTTAHTDVLVVLQRPADALADRFDELV